MEKGKDIEEILRGVSPSRCVGVEITNRSSVSLRNPSVFCSSGHTRIPPIPVINPGCKETCVFVKRELSTWGVTGALAYEWPGFSLAIMFFNPFNSSVRSLEYALDIREGSMDGRELESMYHSMRGHRPLSSTYQKDQLGKNATGLVVTLGNFEISATMSNHNKAALRVLIEEKDSPPGYTSAPLLPPFPKKLKP
ncbi:uncharacterized protein LOC142823407 isoform X2 [Pelodiscus sinensis]